MSSSPVTAASSTGSPVRSSFVEPSGGSGDASASDADLTMTDVGQENVRTPIAQTPVKLTAVGRVMEGHNLGLNSPGFDFSLDRTFDEASAKNMLSDETWTAQHLPDPFNPHCVAPVHSVSLTKEQEAHFHSILDQAQARATELDKQRR